MTQQPAAPTDESGPGTVQPGGVEDAPRNPVEQPPARPEDAQYIDFWGSTETHDFFLKDGKQFFTIKPMNEGAKAQYQKKTNRGFRMNQRSNEARMDVDPAGDRHQLIKDSVVDWLIMQKTPNTGGPGQSPAEFSPFPFAPRNVDVILEQFDPKVIQDLEFFIRTKNPWMQAEMDLEEIDEQIAQLHELRKQHIEEKAGEGSSSSK